MDGRANAKTYLAISVSLLLMRWASAAAAVAIEDGWTRPGIRRDHAAGEIIVKFRARAAESLEEEISSGAGAPQLAAPTLLDRLNKRFRLRSARPLFKNFRIHRERMGALAKKYEGLLSERERRILKRLRRAPKQAKVPALERIYRLRFELRPGESVEDILTAYRNSPNVEYAELNYIVSIDKTPNDPHYTLQWPLNNTGQHYPYSGSYGAPPGTPDSDIDAPEAWDMHTGSPQTIVAVVDSGVDYNHRDLADNIWFNEAEISGTANVDDDDNGYVDDIYGYNFAYVNSDPTDDHGHGTHCAGIIAARGNNGLDIAGVCWNALIMSVKLLNSVGEGYSADAVTAIYYAVDNGADIISCSWGGTNVSAVLAEAIDYAHSQGVIVVASAGNDNSDTPHYPAYYDKVIAVAATDSDDQRARFSTYGDWVDIAASGVDILSLQAEGTSRGVSYTDYTTILSGTSAACPHVSGACALLLSLRPTLTTAKLYDILMGTVDPIAAGICRSNGRLNLFDAMVAAVPWQGLVSIERDCYSCSTVVSVLLADSELRGKGNHPLTLTTGGGDSEIVVLAEVAESVGVFSGAIGTGVGDIVVGDGLLQVSHGDIITATYEDEDNGVGLPVVVTDTAVADCEGPDILNVQVNVPGPEPVVTFQTDEPSTARVLCGPTCGGPYVIDVNSTRLATGLAIALKGVSPSTEYYFVVEATDVVGNKSVDDNMGQCYAFTTTAPGELRVPSQCSTIQEAIRQCWDGGKVLVADETYTGWGNRDVDFLGRAITVKSKNGPEKCMIDCESTFDEPHHGFHFSRGEDGNSVLDGFTITNGYARSNFGGGVKCIGASPAVTDCVFIENTADYGGGGAAVKYSSAALRHCTFRDNLADYGGATHSGADSTATLIECSFTGNVATGLYGDGGAMANQDCAPHLVNCVFRENVAADADGGAMANQMCAPTTVIEGCIFSANVAAEQGGGMDNYWSHPTVKNCIFTGNTAGTDGGGICNNRSSPSVVNCTFHGNRSATTGGMHNYRKSQQKVTNSIFWGNSGAQIGGSTVVTYSNVQGSIPGEGNIDVDPCFAQQGYWADANDPNVVAEPNDANAVWADGDYHLKSQAGRWEPPGNSKFVILNSKLPNAHWVRDDLTSPCIDAGDPMSSIGHEPFPNGGRVNMGAYGGTFEASKSYFGRPVCETIIAGDINGDCSVDMLDFAFMALHWLDEI